MLLAMQRIFVEPEYTQTANEAALLTTDPAGLDAQSEDGNWTWTLETANTPSPGDLSDLVDYWRAEHEGESLLAAIEGFTASQRQQEIEAMTCSRCLRHRCARRIPHWRQPPEPACTESR